MACLGGVGIQETANMRKTKRWVILHVSFVKAIA